MRSLGRGAAGNSPDAHPLQMTLWTDREVGLAWNVRISRRARRMSMRVFPGGRVEVIVPQGAGLPAVERFVARHRDWAERRSKELLQLAPQSAERRPEAVEIRLLDRQWSIEYVPGRRVRAEEIGDSILRVHSPAVTDRHASQALVPWVTHLARQELSHRLRPLAAELGIDYSRMTVRRQRTRWGSCSTRGTISLNVCLLFQRPEVVRYLMIHELCHRRHMNHSQRFWSLVASFEPGWKPLDVELLQGWRHVPAWVFP
ncbi:MAG: M48 family metallopeptidase [Gammaproteobacteria bacterium]|nr:M48 family metallopeptidase [Gammaproteobacteria bacterium]MDH4312421.1 M48 family metallopeptidase [Gammaproteobacteria bacterium]MDH5273965.1 M48 family metallopeptidase [Gammaproteobacteria bacterium]